jgi:2',3'-cyclic-nucleotide 2'-phosphodiesterase (5'-nucleotidase family)
LGHRFHYTIAEVEGCKVGITSVMSDTIRREIIPDRTPEEAAVADLQWGDPAEALAEVLKKFDEENVDFRVLLSQSTDEEIREQAKAFPQFDIIVAADGKDGDREPEMIGSVRLLRVGEKGKTAGVVGLYPKGEKTRFDMNSSRSRLLIFLSQKR